MTPVDPDDPPTLPTPSANRTSGTLVADDATNASSTYVIGEVLGRGGMGEVLQAHDRKIGRDVALKRLRAAAPGSEEVARFLREARIQARLDHPSIVPVYELGKDGHGRPFFTMRRLAGTTLSELLHRDAVTRQRLLRAFADVCRAVDFAHAKGVVHRDLKPSNIVLGDYGEVYVIDWGVAGVVADAPDTVETADLDTLEGPAPSGQTVGTPGYVAPEQLHHPAVGRPADVYALGAILFEILAGEPLHPRGDGAVHSTLAGTTVLSPARRRPDRAVPPELDALCEAMLASKPSIRPSARRCAEHIEEYLDGDRDLARRRAMAHDLVSLARDQLAEGDRPAALRSASRALALDPDATPAAELVMSLMLEPPRDPPPELQEALRASDDDDVRRHARAALPGYFLIAAFLPLFVWNGVRDWFVVLGFCGSALIVGAAAWGLVRHPRRSLPHMVAYAIGNAAILIALGRLIGPIAVLPALATFITGSVVTYPTFLERPALLVGIMLAGFLGPIALEAAGALGQTWEVAGNAILSYGAAIELDGGKAVATVLAGAIATIAMAGIQAVRISRARRAAQHQLVVQAWHLRQLLPR